MIVLTTALLGFAVADLMVWSLDAPGVVHGAFAAVLAALSCGGVAALSGQSALTAVVVLGFGSFALASGWLWLSRRKDHAPLPALAFMIAIVAAAFALSGSFAASSGPLDRWYDDLPFPLLARVPLDQFLVALASALFLLATANQVVRLVLAASDTSVTKGESTLKGGRVIGPMERLFVMAMVISGAVTAAAALIAAKGLLRLPEIRTKAQQKGGQDDEITEYFLIGTFTSLLLAAALGGATLAAG